MLGEKSHLVMDYGTKYDRSGTLLKADTNLISKSDFRRDCLVVPNGSLILNLYTDKPTTQWKQKDIDTARKLGILGNMPYPDLKDLTDIQISDIAEEYSQAIDSFKPRIVIFDASNNYKQIQFCTALCSYLTEKGIEKTMTYFR